MSKTVVSIIIATYNAEQTIERALQSVLNQSYQDWECIVVDGLSMDKTMSVVERYVNLDERFKYLSEKDNGIYDAFNKGWRLAKGEWIYYLGSDDWLTERSFTDFFADGKIYEGDVAIVMGNVNRIARSGNIRLIKANGFQGSHQGMITRKCIIEEMKGFNIDFKFLADAELKFRIKQHGYSVVNVDTTIATIKSGGASDKWKNQIEMARERKKFYSLDPTIKHPNVIIVNKIIYSTISIIISKLKNIVSHK